MREPTHDPLGEDISARQWQGTGTVGEEGSEHNYKWHHIGGVREQRWRNGSWIVVMPKQGGNSHANL